MPYLNRYLAWCRRRYERGDHIAVLEALHAWLTWCHGRPPDWIVEGYHAALMKWFSREAPTLDAAFGVRRSPGEHTNDTDERDRLRPFVMFEVEALRQQKVPLRVAFDRLGADVGHGGGFVKDLYYDKASAGMLKFLRALRVRKILPKT
jgi:hypothetical protein